MSITEYDRETGEVLPSTGSLIFASRECGEVFGALCDMQGKMAAPKRTKTAKVKGTTRNGSAYEYEYKYAPLEEIIETVKAPMSEAGLAYRQFLAQNPQGWVMRTVIGHRSGQWMACDYPIFWDQARGMQGFASGSTYARRYGLMLALGIAAEDDDDANVADGNAATVLNKAHASTGRYGARQRAEANWGGEGSQEPVTHAQRPANASVEASVPYAIDPSSPNPGRQLIAGLDGAKAAEEVDQWIDLNGKLVADFQANNPKAYGFVQQAVLRARDRIGTPNVLEDAGEVMS